MVGVDEVGRGCWAGPLLVVAARATDELPPGLKDSKLLSRSQRDAVYGLLSTVCQFGEGWVSANEIDKHGLAKALRLGISRALKDLGALVDEEVILDGKVNYLPAKFEAGRCLINADSLVPIVSAASVYAKVKRDQYMSELAKKYPAYGFEAHVGYGTKAHQQALGSLGFIKLVHRLSYAPIARLVETG
jgi:ribonuclease HII